MNLLCNNHFVFRLLIVKDIDSEGKIAMWPNSKKKWTDRPKLGWSSEGLEYFDRMIVKEDEDRRLYKKHVIDNKIDKSCRVDMYMFDGSVEDNEECVVNADEVIEI